MAERITDLARMRADLRGGVVAIGNFDGLHRGHQAVLGTALEIAGRIGRPAEVLTFEPHPRTVFAPAHPVFRLTPAPMKAELLGHLGFSAVFEQHFDATFSALSAEAFIDEILIRDLGVAHVVTGFDFQFGKGRRGTPAMLAEVAAGQGFAVTQVPAFSDEGGAVVSSSRIRALLAEGHLAEANGLLGYRFSVRAEIIHGKKLGRTLGFPTANMALPHETMLAPGIYAVRLRRADGSLHDAVASFGRRPTTDEPAAPLLLETFIFDGTHDLYGETCTVSLFGYLRPELKFDGLDPLIAQMQADTQEARALLAGVTPLSDLDARIAF